MVNKKSEVYKPNIGKVFALRKSNKIPVQWTTEPTKKQSLHYYSGRTYLDNSNSDISALILDEWTNSVKFLYNGYLYKISKFYLLRPINDSQEPNEKINKKLQTLIKQYFSIIGKNINVSEEFINFGTKLKQFQEFFEKNEQKL